MLAAVALAGLAGALLAWRGLSALGPPPLAASAPVPGDAPTTDLVAQGAYLARIGHCRSCHSVPGRPAFAGGRAIATPYGPVVSSNLTPDPRSGLGEWTESDFAQALRQGRSRDGRLLSPAFPYPYFAALTDADVRALWAYLRSVPAVPSAPPATHLIWPFGSQWALAVWRGLWFWPTSFQPRADQSAAWNRGAYLAQTLGHCGACHDRRSAFGAARQRHSLDGQAMPGAPWVAPSLLHTDDAGVQDWPTEAVAECVPAHRQQRAGPGQRADGRGRGGGHPAPARRRPGGAGPLAAKPASRRRGPGRRPSPGIGPSAWARGRQRYQDHCADCHGDQGQGAGPYPALAGNRLLTQASAANLVRSVIEGGFEPATASRPRPYGMPPYGPLMGDADLSDLVGFLRARPGATRRSTRPAPPTSTAGGRPGPIEPAPVKPEQPESDPAISADPAGAVRLDWPGLPDPFGPRSGELHHVSRQPILPVQPRPAEHAGRGRAADPQLQRRQHDLERSGGA